MSKYIPSIIQTEEECYECGNTLNLSRHELIGGNGRRHISQRNGLWIWLCINHHDKAHCGKDKVNIESKYHKLAQEAFEREHSREEFFKLFNMYYL